MDELYKRRDVYVGKVAGASYGYKRDLRVTVSVELRHQPGDRQTVNHEPVTSPVEFAITTAVWRPDNRDWVMGGATVEPLRELTTYAPGFSAEQAEELLAMSRWHLNTLRAGCAHQGKPVYKQGRYGREVDLDATPACPETGYRYGHAWLTEPLPDKFQERVEAALPGKYEMVHSFEGTDLVPGYCVHCGGSKAAHREA